VTNQEGQRGKEAKRQRGKGKTPEISLWPLAPSAPLVWGSDEEALVPYTSRLLKHSIGTRPDTARRLRLTVQQSREGCEQVLPGIGNRDAGRSRARRIFVRN
jgi:hypothetical protein